MANDCSCIYLYSGDYESLQCYNEKKVKARKVHRCGECYRDIQTGEIYTRCSGIDDDGWCTYKICPDCWSVVDAYFCDRIIFEHLWEDMREHIRDCAGHLKIPIRVLTPNARRKICDLAEEYVA